MTIWKRAGIEQVLGRKKNTTRCVRTTCERMDTRKRMDKEQSVECDDHLIVISKNDSDNSSQHAYDGLDCGRRDPLTNNL